MKGKLRLEPRDYQVEAWRWALSKGRAVVCMPTGTGKTLVAGLWIRELLRTGRARRVLVLEPTRFLVEQTARFLRVYLDINAKPLHGSLPVSRRVEAWNADVVVATPEIIVAEWERFEKHGFDALVVDECHHTTGQDPYKVVVRKHDFKYRLGLTALVPSSRRKEIEEYIGTIRCWSWSHPSVSKYIPAWAAEIYEAPLNEIEMKLYESLEDLWETSRGRERALIGNAIRWYVRDGAAALRETLGNSARLRGLLEGVLDLVWHSKVRDAHKLGALRKILEDHEGFGKAIVFVDRIVIARLIQSELRDYGIALILGRRHVEPHQALRLARREDVKLVIASSAGEEGIDLPEADLLVLWSNTASPLRFVQRLGRILRPKPGLAQKYAAFIVTPDTVDVDNLIDGMMEARKAGVYLSVEPETIRFLIDISRRRKVLDILYSRPVTADLIAQALESSVERVNASLRWLCEKGYVAYIYTDYGKVYFLQDNVDAVYRYYSEYLSPKRGVQATIVPMCGKRRLRVVRSADYDRGLGHLLRALVECGELSGVRATVFTLERGVIRSRNLVYSFRIGSERVVRVVVDNIYSNPVST